MTNVVVVFPKPENARNIRNLLVRGGYEVAAVCTSGTAALQAADRLGEGILVCGYRFPDMLYYQLHESLPPTFSMLLVASQRVIEEGVPKGIKSVCMPLKAQELLDAVEELSASHARERRRRKAALRKRSEEEQQRIDQAKALLMERNHMSEEEAHRYLQKTSMDNGTNIVETAEMLLSLFGS